MSDESKPHAIRVQPDVVLAMEYLFLLVRHGRHPQGLLWNEIQQAKPATMSDYIRVILKHYRPKQEAPTRGRGPRLSVRASDAELAAWTVAASPMSRGAWTAMALELWCRQYTHLIAALPPQTSDTVPADVDADEADTEDDEVPVDVVDGLPAAEVPAEVPAPT